MVFDGLDGGREEVLFGVERRVDDEGEGAVGYGNGGSEDGLLFGLNGILGWGL